MRKLTQTLALLVLTLSLLLGGCAAPFRLPVRQHIDRLGNGRIAR